MTVTKPWASMPPPEVPAELLAKVQLEIGVLPLLLNRPPPYDLPSRLAAELPASVQPVSASWNSSYTPPPEVAESPLMVQLVSVALPASFATPPPKEATGYNPPDGTAEFPAIVQPVSVAVPLVIVFRVEQQHPPVVVHPATLTRISAIN